jgi:hypothetical protein
MKSTLSKYKFRLINRHLSAKLEFVRDYVNVTSQRYYSPTINVSADDQLQKWKGRGRYKRKIQRKADKTGLLSWELVDDYGYCVCSKFEHVMAEQWESEGSTLPKNQYYLQQLLMSLDNNQHIVVCDQGVLGGFENAQYLLDKGFKFIMTCRPT